MSMEVLEYVPYVGTQIISATSRSLVHRTVCPGHLPVRSGINTPTIHSTLMMISQCREYKKIRQLIRMADTITSWRNKPCWTRQETTKFLRRVCTEQYFVFAMMKAQKSIL